MRDRILPSSDEDDEEQTFETGDDLYSELDFELLSDRIEEGHIYESIQDELDDYNRLDADDMEDE